MKIFEAVEKDLEAQVGLLLVIIIGLIVILSGAYILQQEIMYGGLECFNQTGMFCR